MNPVYDELFAIAIGSQNDGLNGGISLAMIGSLLWEPIFALRRSKTADLWVFKMATRCLKWLPAVLRDSSLYRHRKWPPYGRSSLDGEFSTHWNALNGFNVVQWAFKFCFTIFSLNSDFPGMDYHR